MFKTYDMPYEDRVKIFRDTLPISEIEDNIYDAQSYVALMILLVVVVAIAIIVTIYKDLHLLAIFMFFMEILLCVSLATNIKSLIDLNHYQQEQKSVLKNNEHHMKYISYDLKGEINQITPKRYNDKENVLILFESENKVYSLELNNDIPVKVGDEIRVKSTKKIPTSDKYQINNLNKNTPKKVKLNIDIKHNKEWKHYEVKTNENS